MHSTTITSIVTLLTSTLTVALPQAYAPFPANGTISINGTNATNATVTPPARYYLKTQVISSSYNSTRNSTGNSTKDGLYVSGYHTGAGTNDVTLQGIVDASVGFLNASYQQFDYGTSFPWGMDVGDDTNYAGWEFAYINVGYGSDGFYFTSSGLQWNVEDGGFDGWLACDWWHGVPQLFWLSIEYNDTLPSSCSQINLVPVAVS
ncbi:hypothetical protein MMC28_005832 [Mycoblastus sanguinarius]|nr:hypothetical protein [Mycoblastus sanguinarius]